MTYTFKLARRLAVSQSCIVITVLLLALSTTPVWAQQSSALSDEFPRLLQSFAFRALAFSVLAAVTLGIVTTLANWLSGLRRQLPWQIAIVMLLASGIVARQVVNTPIEVVTQAAELSSPAGAKVASQPRTDFPGIGAGAVDFRTLARAAFFALAIFPFAWWVLSRRGSGPVLEKVALPFSMGFFLEHTGGPLVDWLREVLTRGGAA